MKLVSFLRQEEEGIGIIVDSHVYPVNNLYPDGPANMQILLDNWDQWYDLLQRTELSLKENQLPYFPNLSEELQLIAPVSKPGSCRDGYAFRQHVETARRNRGLPMIAAFDEYPVFYFTNHRSIQGPGPVYCMPDHFHQLDFELEAAVIIGKQGTNISAEKADEHIAGLTIMNDLSARTLQMEEMLLNLGPAKGKDFATCIGPWMVTLDELVDREVPCRLNHIGKSWNLAMKAFVNGKQVSEGNLADMDWTFAEIIERASYGAMLYPGDIIGSGTVGTGCFLELNGTAKLANPSHKEQWLQENDRVDLEVEKLGMLSNIILKDANGFSILAKKKSQ